MGSDEQSGVATGSGLAGAGHRVVSAFAGLRARGEKGLMPFVCGGYPGVGDTGRAIVAMARAGACVIEVGIPFSDPIADGPVIASAMHEALGKGATVDGVLSEVASARRSGVLEAEAVGVVGMVSMSIVYRRGLAEFASACKASGIDGLIVPDLPVEECDEVRRVCEAEGLTLSLLAAPTTPNARLERIVRASSGFVYVIARAGITGERSDSPDVAGMVSRVRSLSDLPVACGFGISTADHVRAVVEHADAAIVGSAVVRRMGGASESGKDPASEAAVLCGELSAGLRAR